MKLPDDLREEFRRCGRLGGQTRARRLSPERRTALARRAAFHRWTRQRFGASSFDALGLPGGAMIDEGLLALAEGVESVPSLVVSLAAPRLRREGVLFPGPPLVDADRRLYRLLESEDAGLAHARYLALLRQAASFADACHGARRSRTAHAA